MFILLSAIIYGTAFAVLIFVYGFQVGPQSGKVWSLGGPSTKGIHEYDPTGEYTYKHLNPKFKE